MRILLRHADNDFDALTIANGMEKAGGMVFSVTHDGKMFTIWCKYTNPVDVDHIDRMISREHEAVNARINAAIKS